MGAGESQTQKATGDRSYYRRKVLFPSFIFMHEQASGAQPLCHLESGKTCKFWGPLRPAEFESVRSRAHFVGLLV